MKREIEGQCVRVCECEGGRERERNQDQRTDRHRHLGRRSGSTPTPSGTSQSLRDSNHSWPSRDVTEFLHSPSRAAPRQPSSRMTVVRGKTS
ncbi:hypothetical protein LX32DRAFT_408155 [Colletotrichum zoysiae]|uniref:Uncharacterized protein n=1 Tax=Colletotrichum zoysiae TaxID=1216348 RepID=A0AAD9HHF6_9PEZI|nr:hypothetical protein LX32DRAFT_408155 [Colletotrichum zoysiae]